MKKILKIASLSCLFFYSFSISAQTTVQDYLDVEEIRIQKADSVEVEVANFIVNNLNNYILTPELEQEITDELLYVHDATDEPIIGDDLYEVILNVKKQELRKLYFVQHPEILYLFEATEVPEELRIFCINGGFENGNTAGYTFRNATIGAARHMNHGCTVNMNTNTLPIQNPNGNTPINGFAAGFNQFQGRASIVTPGNEPFLASLPTPININRVRTGNFALKINPSTNAATFQNGEVTSVSRDFIINEPSIEFSFLHLGYVVPATAHNQPFFRYRLYSIDAAGNSTGVLRDVCIPMNFNNCRYVQVNDPRFVGGNTLAYTPDWVCQNINTADLINQNVRLEFIVSDCEYRGHFSTVYIDDLCGVSCPPTWGSINLNPLNLNCPTGNFQVCGTFQLPDQSTIGNISLQIVDAFGNPIGAPINNSVIIGNNFCFTVDPIIFGANPTGTFSFQVTANLNNSPCIQILTDELGVISFNNCCQPTANLMSPNQNVNNLSPFVNGVDPLAVRQLERSNSITATNVIGVGDNAFQNGVVYHAGDFLEFNPGFEAVNGSQFAAYIEDCSGNYVYRNQEVKPEVTFLKEDVEINLIRISKPTGFSIIPNPANSSIKIFMDKAKFNKMTITSIDGKIVLDKTIPITESFELDISNYQQGIYIISVRGVDGQLFTQKLIKN